MTKITILSLLSVGLSLSPITWAVNFPTTAGVEDTPSLGQFAVRLNAEAGAKFGLNCPGDWDNPDDPCVIWSPVLAEDITRIGRSAPHQDGDNTDEIIGAAIGCDAGQDGCLNANLMPELVKDSDLQPFPEKGFMEGPSNTKEVHTQILSLNMTDPTRDKDCPTTPSGPAGSSANAVRAGSAMKAVPLGERNRSLGEVESLNEPTGDFPAESFFNMFVEVDLDWDHDSNIDMVLYNPTIPLTVQNSELTGFPPQVVYIHGGNTNDGAPPIYDLNTGELVGWLILAGHGVGCSQTTSPQEGCSHCTARQLFAMELRDMLPTILKRFPMPIPSPTPPTTPLPPPTPSLTPLPPTMNLTINFSGTGHGYVTTDPSGIDCESSELECSHSFDTATWVNLIPTAATNSKFTHWGGHHIDCNDGEVFMNGYRFCTAYFESLRFPLIITVVGKGKVSSEPEGINCGNQCKYLFDTGTNVTLTTIPESGWQLQGWGGDCDKGGSVIMNDDKACQVTFVSVVDAGTNKSVHQNEVPQKILDNNTPARIPSVEPSTNIFSGTVYDQFGVPVVGATLQIGDKTFTTDEQGYWQPDSPTPASGTLYNALGEPLANAIIQWGDQMLTTDTEGHWEWTKPTLVTTYPQITNTVTESDSQDTPAYEFFSSLPPQIPPCYTSSLVDGVCNAHGQQLTDLTVGPNGMIAYGTLVGTLINHGWVSNLTLEPQSRLTGGIVTGYIDNHGEMADFEFRGADLVGGVVAGQITNTSHVNGYFRDVRLAAGTHLSGVQLVGKISGDAQAPAVLEHLEIQAGSHLEYVTIGEGVKLASDIIWGEGIQFNNPSDDPRLWVATTDTGTADEAQATQCDTDLPWLETIAFNLQNETIATMTQVGGDISINENSVPSPVQVSDLVKVLGHFCVDSEHVGQLAELIAYAAYQAPTASESEIRYYMLNIQDEIVSWDGELAHLVPFQEIVLEKTQTISIYQGQFPLGLLNIYLGYQIPSVNIFFFNQEPIEVLVVE